jgi:membrane-bound serine protease (ClpP class)
MILHNREVKMELLINPNVAYLLIVISVLLTFAAIIVPGTGGPEAVLILCVIAASYISYQIGINMGAVAVLVLSVIPFFASLRTKSWRIPLAAVTIIMIIASSIFLFTGTNGLPIVDPILAVIVSLLSGGFIWLGVDRSTIALQQAPIHNLDDLIGKTGQARTAINKEGSIHVDGELWSACSEQPIEAGSTVRIIHRDGLILTVEEAK